MNEIKFDEFFKDNFDTTGIEDNIYNQIAKDMARCVDIDLAKTPLVDILTGYTRYKIQELEIERLHSIIKEVREKAEMKIKGYNDIINTLIYSSVENKRYEINELKYRIGEQEELLEILKEK